MTLIHGGDTFGYFIEHGKQPLDFSVNCNPLGVPKGVQKAIADCAASQDAYPDPLCRELSAAIAAHEGLLPENVLCGNGASDLIYRAVLALKPARALVLAPTFADYEAALHTVGCTVNRYELYESSGWQLEDDFIDSITDDTNMVFLCSPNNPTGVPLERAIILSVLERCREIGAILVVDECFNGFLEEPESWSVHPVILRQKKDSPLLILKAFTKLYGMAGIRLGYALSSNTELLEKMRAAGPGWNVSGVAQKAGAAALKETAYLQTSLALIRTERAKLKAFLTKAGCTKLSGDANYIFFYSRIPELDKKFRDRGILIRNCDNYPALGGGWYRIGVRAPEENERFIQALQQILDARKL